jgi:hypothetical protein
MDVLHHPFQVSRGRTFDYGELSSTSRSSTSRLSERLLSLIPLLVALLLRPSATPLLSALVSPLLSIGSRYRGSQAHLPLQPPAQEYLQFTPLNGQTCQAYMAPYIASAGGYLLESTATSTTECSFCSLAETNVFLQTFNYNFANRWVSPPLPFRVDLTLLLTHRFAARLWDHVGLCHLQHLRRSLPLLAGPGRKRYLSALSPHPLILTLLLFLALLPPAQEGSQVQDKVIQLAPSREGHSLRSDSSFCREPFCDQDSPFASLGIHFVLFSLSSASLSHGPFFRLTAVSILIP